MDTIIRTPAVSARTRQLVRPLSAAARAAQVAAPSIGQPDQDRQPAQQRAERQETLPPQASVSAAPPGPASMIAAHSPPLGLLATVFNEAPSPGVTGPTGAFASSALAAPAPPPVLEPVVDPQAAAENERVQQALKVEQELIERREEAERRGFASGFERGQEAGTKALADQVERMLAISATLQKAKSAVLETAQDAIVEIAYTALCRVIGTAVADRATVTSMVNHALGMVNHRDEVTVWLHPQDAALVQQTLAHDETSLTCGPATAVRGDPSLDLGGCIVESATGSLDARLDTQLGRLREALMLARHGYTAEPGES